MSSPSGEMQRSLEPDCHPQKGLHEDICSHPAPDYCHFLFQYYCGGILEKVPDILANATLPVVEYPVPEKDPDIVSPE